MVPPPAALLCWWDMRDSLPFLKSLYRCSSGRGRAPSTSRQSRGADLLTEYPRLGTVVEVAAVKAAARVAQVALMGRLMEPVLLRRQRSEVGASASALGLPTVEVSIPVDLSREQRECYRVALVRFYDVLADPRPPRHAGHRAAQMRTVCSELRKVGVPVDPPAPPPSLCSRQHMAYPACVMSGGETQCD